MTEQTATVQRVSLDTPRPPASGQEEDGVEILRVQEIGCLSALTPLPDAPAYVKGVLTLRGTIVPIVDPRELLGVAEVEGTPLMEIAVVHLRGQRMGFLVDPARDVLSVTGACVQPTTDLPGQVAPGCPNSLAGDEENMGRLPASQAPLAGATQARSVCRETPRISAALVLFPPTRSSTVAI